jgi:hypothetical protein
MSFLSLLLASMLVLAVVCVPSAGQTQAGSKLVELRVVDDQHLSLFIKDGEIRYKDDGLGPTAFMGHESQGGEVAIQYGTLALDAAVPGSFRIHSVDDSAYAAGVEPLAVFRRTKCNGVVAKWPEPDTWTLEHTLYLKLPEKLKQGASYTVDLAPALGVDSSRVSITFDAFSGVSEAIRVNLIGYHPDHPIKAADLYMWLGDGGGRDYSDYAGRDVWLVDVETGVKTRAGTVEFWKPSGKDSDGWNFTQADVWRADFSSFARPGTYRLAIEGVGCSMPFKIARDAYAQPFKTSVLGFYYMRIGEPKDARVPAPRQPRFIPDVDPPGFNVFYTTMSPWHPDWKGLGGDPWDRTDWSKYKLPGEPTNPQARGGHSDALDWDRHIGHISIIYDLLLPYLLSNGALSDDDCGIRESGNGVPDLIDEAQNEVDFWLSLRDPKGGYGAGLNNPPREHNTMYQADSRPYTAWANAANAAMLAEAYRVAGKPDEMRRYRDAAIEAWNVAGGEDLDFSYTVGDGQTRGRDLKMLAAACLYNLTGERSYEDALAAESLAHDPASTLDQSGSHTQYWPTAVYLLCAKHQTQPIRHPELVGKMKAMVLRDSMTKNVEPSTHRPTRRATDQGYWWFQTSQNVHAAIIAHALTDDVAQREALLRAMILEADWGLGRNPMNMVQMTGLGPRFPTDIYTSGKNDGVPGVHPGHTPYMNANGWSPGFMGDPQWYASRGHPTWDRWPQGEALWQARYCYSNNEFTPQQTMRGKMALLGYLHALGKLD